MFLTSLRIFRRPISTSTKPTPLSWRTQCKESQLVLQISSTLLQRHNWAPLLPRLNPSRNLTPSLFLRILHRTQTNPQISLSFFNWAKSNLGFQPDLKSLCKLAQVLIGSRLTRPAKPILDSLVQAYPPTQIGDSLVQVCKGITDPQTQSLILSSVLEVYCKRGLFLQALEFWGKIKLNGNNIVSIHSCNALLDLLQEKNEIQLGWCFYCSMLRNELELDQFTWCIVARLLSKDGKLGKLVKILEMGVYNSVIYSLIIDSYSKRGQFGAAFRYLNEMKDRKLRPGFSTYGSILEGACRYDDVEVRKEIMDSMVERGLIPQLPFSEYDSIIQKLSDLGNTYSATMFFNRARDEKIELQGGSYGCLLRALSKVGNVEEAIAIYHIMLEKGTVVNDSCYDAFANVLCEEDPSEEVSELIRDVVRKGVRPCSLKLSNYITSLCDKGRWKEAEELLNEVLEKGFLPGSFCCHSLIKHYISTRRIGLAIVLQNEMEKLGGALDVNTYNLLLTALFKEKRPEEAVAVFDNMRRQNLVSSESFSVMISGLCGEKELRKAMKIHDEMLKTGLKPDKKTYKRLIRGFK